MTPEPEPEPEPEPIESLLVCEGGHYFARYDDWSFENCPDSTVYSRGVYWLNADDEMMFLIGDTVYPESIIEVYGACPAEYIEEFLLE